MLWKTFVKVLFLEIYCVTCSVSKSSRLCFNDGNVICNVTDIHCDQNQTVVITDVETRRALNGDGCTGQNTCSGWSSNHEDDLYPTFNELIFRDCFYQRNGVCSISGLFPYLNPTGKWYADVHYTCGKQENMIELCSSSSKTAVQREAHIYYNGKEQRFCHCNITGVSVVQLTTLIMCNTPGYCSVSSFVYVGEIAFNSDYYHQVVMLNVSTREISSTVVSLNLTEGDSGQLLVWMRAIGSSLTISCGDTINLPDTSLSSSTSSTSHVSSTPVSSPSTAKEQTPTHAPEGRSTGTKNTTAAIAGGLIGTIAFLIIILAKAIFLYRKRNSSKDKSIHENITSQNLKHSNRGEAHANIAYESATDGSVVAIPGPIHVNINRDDLPDSPENYTECDIDIEYARVDKPSKLQIRRDDGYPFPKPTEDEVVVVEPSVAGYSYANVNLDSKASNLNKPPSNKDGYSHIDLSKANPALDARIPESCDQYSHIGKLPEGRLIDETSIAADTYNHISASGLAGSNGKVQISRDRVLNNEYSHIKELRQATTTENNRLRGAGTANNYSHVDLSGQKTNTAVAITDNVYSHLNVKKETPEYTNRNVNQANSIDNDDTFISTTRW